jgi:arogenate/prephenate dehydratase
MTGTRIAYQGEPGAYSEAASLGFFGSSVETLACNNFDQVFASVTNGTCSHGVIPIENSLAGSIHRNYDLLIRHDLHLVGEYFLRVSHCLLALPGVRLEDIETIHSHPQALAQCENNLSRVNARAVAEADTAGSARMVREANNPHAAALASRRAAEVYKLNILVENMEDNPANYTRFLILSPAPEIFQNKDAREYKTSIVFSLRNVPGSLFKAMSVFALRDIDLTKIESRPISGKPWEYLFYIDFIGHAQDSVCGRALAHLGELAPFLRILGSYPRHLYTEA